MPLDCRIVSITIVSIQIWVCHSFEFLQLSFLNALVWWKNLPWSLYQKLFFLPNLGNVSSSHLLCDVSLWYQGHLNSSLRWKLVHYLLKHGTVAYQTETCSTNFHLFVSVSGVSAQEMFSYLIPRVDRHVLDLGGDPSLQNFPSYLTSWISGRDSFKWGQVVRTLVLVCAFNSR